MLCLSQHVGRDELGAAAGIRHNHDLAGACDGVDRDLTKHMLFGKSHKQVAWAHDGVDTWQPFDAIGHRCNSLGASRSHHRCQAEFVTGGEQVRIITTEWCWWSDDHNLPYASNLRRNGGHQQRRWIGSSTTRNADAGPIEWQIPLPQRTATRQGDFSVVGKHRLLKPFDTRPHTTDGVEKSGLHARVCVSKRVR